MSSFAFKARTQNSMQHHHANTRSSPAPVKGENKIDHSLLDISSWISDEHQIRVQILYRSSLGNGLVSVDIKLTCRRVRVTAIPNWRPDPSCSITSSCSLLKYRTVSKHYPTAALGSPFVTCWEALIPWKSIDPCQWPADWCNASRVELSVSSESRSRSWVMLYFIETSNTIDPYFQKIMTSRVSTWNEYPEK